MTCARTYGPVPTCLLTDEAVLALTEEAQGLFIRLFMVCTYQGRFPADASALERWIPSYRDRSSLIAIDLERSGFIAIEEGRGPRDVLLKIGTIVDYHEYPGIPAARKRAKAEKKPDEFDACLARNRDRSRSIVIDVAKVEVEGEGDVYAGAGAHTPEASPSEEDEQPEPDTDPAKPTDTPANDPTTEPATNAPPKGGVLPPNSVDQANALLKAWPAETSKAVRKFVHEVLARRERAGVYTSLNDCTGDVVPVLEAVRDDHGDAALVHGMGCVIGQDKLGKRATGTRWLGYLEACAAEYVPPKDRPSRRKRQEQDGGAQLDQMTPDMRRAMGG